MRSAVIFLAFLIIIFQCRKPNERITPPTNPPTQPPPTPPVAGQGNELNENAFLVDGALVKAQDSGSVVLKKTDTLYKVGDILIILPNGFYDYGDIRKVLSVEQDPETVRYKTTFGTLNEAFSTLDIVDTSMSDYIDDQPDTLYS